MLPRGKKEVPLKTLTGIAFAAGIILAGSDGPFFPWPNLAGVIIFSTVPIAAWWGIETPREEK
jgi:hypothetical protein